MAAELKTHLPIELLARVIGLSGSISSSSAGGEGYSGWGLRAAIYRRYVMLASGCYAMLDEDIGFGLVSGRAVIARLLG
ncbi:hypothetical protein [Pseudomonas azotoformans]|uniref:Uncharacterized protein n=1 Tax=Pseudomonas azotoformans TaxID=47878 RepID=A0A127I1D4_PSEAZ|nr:hypothetical protein [Pseudomonas azotoformans]AMN80569.1 hypothetical protein AYR47_20640 [Pseudomonas azotoformans]